MLAFYYIAPLNSFELPLAMLNSLYYLQSKKEGVLYLTNSGKGGVTTLPLANIPLTKLKRRGKQLALSNELSRI